VKSIASEGGYYFMPDFEICRESFAKRGIHTGKQMCEVILKEAQVAVSSVISCVRLALSPEAIYTYSLDQ
jgi:hypothetical protein